MTAFAAAMDALFADPHLARDAVWRPGGAGDGVSVRVIARRPDRLVDFAGARIVSATALFDLRVAEAPGVAEGDTLEVNGEVFMVQGVPQRDAERLVWTVETWPA